MVIHTPHVIFICRSPLKKSNICLSHLPCIPPIQYIFFHWHPQKSNTKQKTLLECAGARNWLGSAFAKVYDIFPLNTNFWQVASNCCNYWLRDTKNSSSFTKFLVNNVHTYSFELNYYKIHFVTNLMVFIWYLNIDILGGRCSRILCRRRHISRLRHIAADKKKRTNIRHTSAF